MCFTFVCLITHCHMPPLIGWWFTICQMVHKIPILVIDLKLLTLSVWKFTEHVNPLFIMTGDHFTTSSMVASGEGTGFFFSFFFLHVLAHFHSPGLPKRSCTYLWQGEYFLNWKDNWFVVNFSHPILGRTFLSGGRTGGGCQFLPVCTVCTLNKIFPFLQRLFSLNTHNWENNLFRKQHCMKLYACQSVAALPKNDLIQYIMWKHKCTKNWPKVISYGKDLEYVFLWPFRGTTGVIIPQTAGHKMSHKWILTPKTGILCLTVHVVTLPLWGEQFPLWHTHRDVYSGVL